MILRAYIECIALCIFVIKQFPWNMDLKQRNVEPPDVTKENRKSISTLFVLRRQLVKSQMLKQGNKGVSF